MSKSRSTTSRFKLPAITFDLVTDWLQIATSIVVIVGLGLVIWELEQARQLTQAQLTSEGWARWSERNLAIVGDHGAEVLAKACDEPEAMTSTELRVMEAITQDRLNAINRIYALRKDAGLYTEEGAEWTRFSEQLFATIFATQFGRDWWSATRTNWAPEIVALGDSYLSRLGPTSCQAFYQRLGSSAGSSSSPASR